MLGLEDLDPKLFDEFDGIPELGWNGEPQRNRRGHRSVFPKKVPWSMRMKWFLLEHRSHQSGAWPVIDPVDKIIEYGIGRRVYDFVDHIRWLLEIDQRRRFGRPHIFPTSAVSVLTLREHLVKVGRKFVHPSVPIEQHRVVMVRHLLRGDQLDLEPLSRLREAVDKRVVRLLIRSKQELTLRAAPREQVTLRGEHLARLRHAAGTSTRNAKR